MSNKFICPKCGGDLEYWKDYLVTKTQSINPITGEVGKVITSELEEMDDMSGLKCGSCSWVLNDINELIPDGFTEWYSKYFENINM